MDLRFDNETIVILLYKARRKIASREAIYNCRCSIDSSLSYAEWKKNHIKKEREKSENEKSKNIKAKWIKGAYWSEGCGMGEIYGNYYKCSNCKKEVQDNYEKCSLKYCPYCGKRMSGDVNGIKRC